jgi:hypothetical protein
MFFSIKATAFAVIAVAARSVHAETHTVTFNNKSVISLI